MKKSLFISFCAVFFLSLNACNTYDRLTGNDDDDEESSGPASPNPAPSSSRFDIYKDNTGITEVDPDAGVNAEGIRVEVRPLADAGEGTEYLRVHTDLNGGSFEINFDENEPGKTYDLSPFRNVVFKLRLIRPIVPEDDISLDVEDATGVVRRIDIQSIPGFDPNSFDWQEVRFPVSLLSGLDLTRIKQPFGMDFGELGNNIHLDIDVDDVRWEV
jgi:hypothetical protein